MRTTLDLDERVLKLAKRQALEQGETLTRFIERALKLQLAQPKTRPPFRLKLLIKKGRTLPGVRPDDRDSLHERMEGRS